jgi:hypothetical protein
MWFDPKDFPNLHSGNHRVTRRASRRGRKYNCIAWGGGRTRKMWDPFPQEPEEDYYWPAGVPRDYKLTSLVMAYETEGFVALTDDGKPVDGTLEDGVEKVALYADGDEYMHAACQLANGKWTSKMGSGQRIEHDTPTDLEGPAYGKVAKYMKRERMAGTEP